MFVRTQRLSLRPGWPEDAGELAHAISHRAVVDNLMRAPWPYHPADAEAFLALPRPIDEPDFLIFDHADGAVRLVGGIGVARNGDSHELGYWLTPDAWGRGIATEAGLAVIATLRDTLRLPRLVSGHFVDNPASARVLVRLGFRPSGAVVARHSVARGHAVDCALFDRDLTAGDGRLAA